MYVRTNAARQGGRPNGRGTFLFRRRKTEESKPPEKPAQTGAQAPRDAAGASSGAPFSSNSGRPPLSQAGAAGSNHDNVKDTPAMGRAPLPSGSPLPAGAGIPPMPGARGGLPSQLAGRKDVAEQRTLVVGRGISVQGSVQDAERLVVEGTVESSMINAAELVVMPGGLFRGGVEVESAEISGTVDGSLVVRGSLTVRGTGRLLGKASCCRLKVEDGGQISGQLEMLPENSASATSPATIAPASASSESSTQG
ncbi:bactofilin family protein [Acetobacter papayae]|uniref:bactofilin family protein n=1 Tax=Acetobacter papayae TaxID=1076592 RepID=UPI0018FFEB7E|nr:polymer-forming cytoskeletal protein [Acetobacter papayae]